MPITRDARMDRRRRLLRDAGEAEIAEGAPPRRTSSRGTATDEASGTLPKRKAGYSQDVRRACGQRLVQLIPVRRRSFAAVICVSFLLTGGLLAAHYWVHVTGQLQWWRHPLAVALDIGHPRSIAAWLSSQLWLLCLGATVLTFQLRRHKLDDYNGEYRLWFWLVATCLVASIDATTSITELFALALDPWAQRQLGWSGPAVVDATLAVLIGMLGLRMCSELKAVPLSLVWWLSGLAAWAVSAALSRPEFQLQLSAPVRYWLTFACWLEGLTLIWLAAVTYLRTVYLEAQQRFLLRGGLATQRIPLGQRLRQSLPSLPSLPAVPRFRRPAADVAEAAQGAEDHPPTRAATRATTRPVATPAAPTAATATAAEGSGEPAARGRDKLPAKKRRWALPTSWLGRPKHSDDAEEFRKLKPATGRAAERLESDAEAEAPARGWLGRVPRPKLKLPAMPRPRVAMPKLRAPKLSLPSLRGKAPSQLSEEPRKAPRGSESRSSDTRNSDTRNSDSRKEKATAGEAAAAARPRGSWIPRVPMPKLGLGALKLKPPQEASAAAPSPAPAAKTMRPVAEAQRPLPGTQAPMDYDDFDDEDGSDNRSLSKAERKRLRRQQQQQRRSA